MRRIREALWLLTIVIAVGACTTVAPRSRPSKPALVPSGWAVDYDYVGGIRSYLRQQYDSARLEGATAYVYIYSDRSPSCRRARRYVELDEVSPLLRDIRVSMLDFWRLKGLSERKPGILFDPGNAPGVLVKIAIDGSLSDARFYSAVFLCCPQYEHTAGSSGPARRTLGTFTEALEQFLARNAET